MTDALAAFVKAQLDDDAQAARAASWDEWDSAHWTAHHREKCDGRWVIVDHADEGVTEVTPHAADDAGVARHIARQDPARTLRGVVAARAVLDLYEEAGDRMDRAMSDGDTVAYQEARIEQRTLRKVLLREAAVHEAHPDYLEEWRT
ncbi:DUF6221 family protein [Streptomyces sp. NPDC006261]|uniref:DUF6221 family protein n=1 Tax=Streptomyces sp. NPDC006261 TaxID=3156739 RepID=UPI0033AE43D0